MANQAIPVFLSLTIVLMIGACAPSTDGEGNQISQNNTTHLSDEDYEKQRQLVIKKFNERATETNERMNDAYLRGQAACNRMKADTGSAGAGCPRPKPRYVELMSTAPLK